jgi:hypothetical protein
LHRSLPEKLLRKGAKMKRRLLVVAAILVLAAIVAIPAAAKGRGHGALGIVYVSSQGLYYDTFVTASSLPMQGPFEKLDNGVVQFGPGQQGYYGGRWWEDTNGNGVMDPGDTYLDCPLLGPGRTSP